MDSWIAPDARLVALALAAAMLAAFIVGDRWGRRLKALGGDPRTGKLDESSLALLGLLLAFNFSMSLGKHDDRRRAVVTKANAIGDFWTCASVLPEPVRGEIRGQLRAYTASRLAIARGPVDAATIERHIAEMSTAQDRILASVAGAVGAGTPVAAPLVNTLNEVTSAFATRVAAFQDRLPFSILVLLSASAILPMALLGRGRPSGEGSQAAGMAVFVALVCLVVYVTLDLNEPRGGLITVSQEPMARLLAGMGGAEAR